jgi:hypothetical protein
MELVDGKLLSEALATVKIQLVQMKRSLVTTSTLSLSLSLSVMSVYRSSQKKQNNRMSISSWMRSRAPAPCWPSYERAA